MQNQGFFPIWPSLCRSPVWSHRDFWSSSTSRSSCIVSIALARSTCDRALQPQLMPRKKDMGGNQQAIRLHTVALLLRRTGPIEYQRFPRLRMFSKSPLRTSCFSERAKRQHVLRLPRDWRKVDTMGPAAGSALLPVPVCEFQQDFRECCANRKRSVLNSAFGVWIIWHIGPHIQQFRKFFNPSTLHGFLENVWVYAFTWRLCCWQYNSLHNHWQILSVVSKHHRHSLFALSDQEQGMGRLSAGGPCPCYLVVHNWTS